jgi:hypothetical protein
MCDRDVPRVIKQESRMMREVPAQQRLVKFPNKRKCRFEHRQRFFTQYLFPQKIAQCLCSEDKRQRKDRAWRESKMQTSKEERLTLTISYIINLIKIWWLIVQPLHGGGREDSCCISLMDQLVLFLDNYLVFSDTEKLVSVLERCLSCLKHQGERQLNRQVTKITNGIRW